MEGQFSGTCHCGRVAFTINGKVLNVVNCHCSICRRANGGAFSSFVVVPEEAFEVVKGQDLLTRYAMSDKGEKHFCRVCGAPVFNRNKLYPKVTVVPLGCLDGPEQFIPKVNIFCERMLPWVAFAKEITCYEKGLAK